MVKSYKIPVEIVFRYDGVDPIYHEIGLNADADEIEIIEDGIVDFGKIHAASQHYEMTQIFMEGGHSLYINMEFDYFCSIWKAM